MYHSFAPNKRYNNLGLLLHLKGDLAASEPLHREALEGQRATLGSRHPSTLTSICNLGTLFYTKGDYAADRAPPRQRHCRSVAPCIARASRMRCQVVPRHQ
mgnify:CR=1 FL=1